MQVQPVVAAQRVGHFPQRLCAKLQADPGQLGVGAFLQGGIPDQSCQGSRHRVRRAGRRQRPILAPPGIGAGISNGIVVGPHENPLALAAFPQAGVQVNPGKVPHLSRVFVQQLAQRAVAPSRRGAAEKHAAGLFILAAGNRCLEAAESLCRDEPEDGGAVAPSGRPRGWKQQRMKLTVSRIGGQGRCEILKIAVEVHVLLRHAAEVRKAVGVERMHIQHRHAAGARLLQPGLFSQQCGLRARAGITFHAMHAAGQEQQLGCLARTLPSGIDRQRFAIAAGQGQVVRRDMQPGSLGGFQKLGARLGVVQRKSVCFIRHCKIFHPIAGYGGYFAPSGEQVLRGLWLILLFHKSFHCKV